MTKITVKDIEKAMREMVEEAFSWGGDEGTRFWLVYDTESDTVHYTTEYYVTHRLPALSCEMISYTPDLDDDEAFELQLKEMKKEYPPEALLDEIKDIISGKDELADWYAHKA